MVIHHCPIHLLEVFSHLLLPFWFYWVSVFFELARVISDRKLAWPDGAGLFATLLSGLIPFNVGVCIVVVDRFKVF